MSRNIKPETSRLNLFYILQVLDNYTDEQNPMSATEIADCINKDFAHVVLSDKVISTDTVKRTLEELLSRIFPEGVDYNEKIHQYGYYIFCVMKEEGKFVPYRMVEGKQAPQKYYYLENDLKLAEILTLKDAVETYSYFSEEDITEIVRKLVRIRQGDFPTKRYIDTAKNNRDENSLLLMNIDILNEIIKHRNRAKITYCYYDVDKMLVPRKGYPKDIKPLHLMWSNGYYYVLAYSEKYDGIVNYRIDRITDVEEVEAKDKNNSIEFNPVQYRYEHPVMFGGNKEKIELLFKEDGKNYFMNVLIDTFGKDIRVAKATADIIEKYLPYSASYYDDMGIKWYKVSFEAVISGVELWAVQYCSQCKVISPEGLVQSVKENLKKGQEMYSK